MKSGIVSHVIDLNKKSCIVDQNRPSQRHSFNSLQSDDFILQKQIGNTFWVQWNRT